MGVRTSVVATTVAAALSLSTACADPTGQVDCIDFETPAAAQTVYDSNPADPNNLDSDDDGRACEALPGQAPGTAEGVVDPDRGPTPSRGVETGAGGTADLSAGAGDSVGAGSAPLLPPAVTGSAVLAAGGSVLPG